MPRWEKDTTVSWSGLGPTPWVLVPALSHSPWLTWSWDDDSYSPPDSQDHYSELPIYPSLLQLDNSFRLPWAFVMRISVSCNPQIFKSSLTLIASLASTLSLARLQSPWWSIPLHVAETSGSPPLPPSSSVDDPHPLCICTVPPSSLPAVQALIPPLITQPVPEPEPSVCTCGTPLSPVCCSPDMSPSLRSNFNQMVTRFRAGITLLGM